LVFVKFIYKSNYNTKVKHLKKFNESKKYYEEIPEDYFLESQDDILPFTNREIEMIKSICDEINTKLKAPKVRDLDNEVYELTIITNVSYLNLGVDDFGNKQRRSLIYKIEDDYFLFGFNVDSSLTFRFSTLSSTFYKADQIDGLLKLLNDKL
jgi:hypothetical protein